MHTASRPRPLATLLLILSTAASTAACSGADSGAQSVPKGGTGAAVRGVDLAAMDRSVKPGDEFYLYANGTWLKTAQIPPDRGSAGTGQRVAQEIEERAHGVLDEAARPGEKRGPNEQKIGDYYATILDTAAIDARGVAPLAPALDRIAKITDARSLSTYLGSSLRADVDPLNNTTFHTDHVLGLWVEQDLNDPSRCAPYLLQGGIGLPDKSFYVDESPRMVEIRTGYVHHLAAMLKLAGIADAEAKANRAFALEQKIARAHASRVDSEDVSKANNPWPRAEFATKAPGMDWEAYLSAAGLDKQASFIVWHPAAVTGLAALVKSEPIDAWKDYLTARTIEHLAGVLPKAFLDEAFAFYGKELRGAEAMPPRWRFAMQMTDDALGEAVGKAYVERYFPPETKRAVESMVQNLITAFGKRIDALAWMSPATKAKAKEKLHGLKIGVGYPDAWRDYSAFSVVRGDALGNLERAEMFEYQRNLKKLGKPVDRGEWAMVPHIVDAVNLPVRNAMNFPAGMLSPPYFDPRATAAANYGAIGSVIGHEISHSFDDQGAKFDAQGHFTNWWTPEDLAHFEASGAALAAQYSAYKPLPDMAIDGKLTLSENIADLAGLAVAYDAWRASLNGAEPPTQDGLTGEQQFFVSFAQGWQSKIRDKALRGVLATNGHAPPHYRALTVRNLDPWYTAFDVKQGEALFLAPDARVRVW